MSNYIEKLEQQIDVNFKQIDKLDEIINSLLKVSNLSESTSYLRELVNTKEKLIISTKNMMKEHMISERYRISDRPKTKNDEKYTDDEFYLKLSEKISNKLLYRLDSLTDISGVKIHRQDVNKVEKTFGDPVGFEYITTVEESMNEKLINKLFSLYLIYLEKFIKDKINIDQEKFRGVEYIEYYLHCSPRVYIEKISQVEEVYRIAISGIGISIW